MAFLKGIDVILHTKTSAGRDAFNREQFTETEITVKNVLVSPLSQEDTAIINELSLNGKKARYILGIPKEDTHNWEDSVIEFFGEKWKSTGFSTKGIDHLVPLDWNRKIVVERYG